MFCNWLSHRDGLSPCYERAGEKIKDYQGNETEYDAWRLDATANGYRLPTAAEWEYACRAGTTTQFSFGDDWRWLDGYGVSRAERAEAGGTKLPNGWGLFDVHGNVMEWCNDAEGAERVNRGGYWYGPARFCASSFRLGNHPSLRGLDLGFRVAAVPFRQGESQESESQQTDQAEAEPLPSSIIGDMDDVNDKQIAKSKVLDEPLRIKQSSPTTRPSNVTGNPKTGQQVSVSSAAFVHLERAHSLAKDGKFDEAIKQYRSSIKDLPIASAHFGLAKALRATGRFDEARVEYRIVLELLGKEVGNEPLVTLKSSDDVRFSIAGVFMSLAGLEKDAGESEAEKSAWGTVVDLLEKKPDPENPVYWGVIGQGYFRIGRAKDSRQAMEKTITLRGETEPTTKGGPRWWYLTMALAKSGETEKARQFYDKLVKQLDSTSTKSQNRLREEAAASLGLLSEAAVE